MGLDLEQAVETSDPSLVVILLGTAAGLIGIWWFIELWLVPGTKGPNRYGIDMRQIPPTYRYQGAPGTTPPDA